MNKIAHTPCYRSWTQIVSVGHSLGGGLAQFAALANPTSGPRIRKVITFNTTPFTGVDLIDHDVLNANATGLVVDRVEEQGEFLSSYQAFTVRQQTAAVDCNPQVRTVQFAAFVPATPGFLQRHPFIRRHAPAKLLQFVDSAEAHKIVPLAAQLTKWSEPRQQTYPLLPGTSEATCPTGYRQLTPPVYTGTPVADLGANGNLYASNTEPNTGFAPGGNFGAAPVGYRADGSYGPIAPPDQQVGSVRLARARHLPARWSGITVRKVAKMRTARMTKKIRTANN